MHFHKYQSPRPSSRKERNSDKVNDISTESDEVDFTHSNSNFKSSQRDEYENYGSKIKRSLCRNFTDKGCCPYGEKCQFAHGTSELRNNMPSNHSYKTRPCFTFINNGYCLYGHRCNFIHQTKPAQDIDDWEKWQEIYRHFREDKDMFRKEGESRLLTGLNCQREAQ